MANRKRTYRYTDAEIMEVYRENPSEAKNLMVQKYDKYVYSFLWKKYKTYMANADYSDDLYDSCMVGLLKAMERYDADRGAFSTFSTRYMIHEVSDFLRVTEGETSSYYADMSNRIAKAMQMGMQTAEEISSHLHLNPSIVERELKVIDMKNGQTPIDDAWILNPHPPVDEEFAVADLLSCLTKLQRTIVKMHVLEDMSFKKIAAELGTTPYNIRKIFDLSIHILREEIEP